MQSIFKEHGKVGIIDSYKGIIVPAIYDSATEMIQTDPYFLKQVEQQNPTTTNEGARQQ